MFKGKFSTHILLIGLVLIGFNTLLMLCNVGYQIMLLIVTLIWSVIKIVWLAFCDYPMTLVALFFMMQIRKLVMKQNKKKNLNFIYNLLLQVFASSQQCCICLQQNVNIILPQCGHYYHYKCIAPWVKSKQFCPFCRTNVPLSTLSSFSFLKSIKHIFKANKKIILLLLILTIFLGYKYHKWYVGIFVSQIAKNKSIQLCLLTDWLLSKS